MDEGDGGCGIALEVTGQVAVASDPGKRSFDDPSLGQDLEAFGTGSLDDLQIPSPGSPA